VFEITDVSTALRAEFPALRNPAAPSFDASLEPSLEQCDELVMREPVGEPVGPILVDWYGNGRSMHYVDPTLTAQLGDCVLIEAGPRMLAHIAALAEHDPDWSAQHPSIPNLWVKQLREPGGSCLPLMDCRVLGVLVRIKPRTIYPHPRRPWAGAIVFPRGAV
jgi:hypothetical protein